MAQAPRGPTWCGSSARRSTRVARDRQSGRFIDLVDRVIERSKLDNSRASPDRNRPSDVPPLVESAGRTPAIDSTDALSALTSKPRGVRNGSPMSVHWRS